MQCEFCRSDNTEEAKFCFACGRPLIVEYNIKNVDTDPKCESAQSQEDKPLAEKMVKLH